MARFLTLNVNGLGDQNKRLSFLQWLSQLSVDFVCLQETHVSSESECSSWFSSFGFLSLASPGSVHSCGMVLLYRPRFTLCNFPSDAAGRSICAEFSYNDISFHVVSLYAPNRNPDRDTFLQFVSERVDPGSPPPSAGISTLSSTGPGIVGALPLRQRLGILLGHSSLFSGSAVWWTFGVTSTHTPLPLPGSDRTGLAHLESTLSAALSLGCTMSNHATLFPALTRTMRQFFGCALSRCPCQGAGALEIQRISPQGDRLYSGGGSHLKAQIDNGRVSLLDPYEGVLQQIALLDKAEAEDARLRARVRWAEGGDVFPLLFETGAPERGSWLDLGYSSPRWLSGHRPSLYL